MMIWEIILASFVVISGVSLIVTGETNTMRTFSIAQAMLDEQMTEWTVYSAYETSEPIPTHMMELGENFHISVSRHPSGSCNGIDIHVAEQDSNQDNTLFVPECF